MTACAGVVRWFYEKVNEGKVEVHSMENYILFCLNNRLGDKQLALTKCLTSCPDHFTEYHKISLFIYDTIGR